MSQELDRCPACGGSIVRDEHHNILVCEVCIYCASPRNHRRLCAEVALARVVVRHQQLFRVFAKHQRWDVAAACNEIEEAIACVREASK